MQTNSYALVLFFTAALTVVLCAQAWKRRDMPCAKLVFWMAVSMVIWTGAAAMEAMVTTIPLKYTWSVIAYIGTVSTPVLFLMIAFTYAGKAEVLYKPGVLVLLWGIPVGTVLMALTNPWHGYLWRDISLRESVFGVVGVYARGGWFWVFIAHAYGMVILAVIMLIRCVFVFPAVFKGQAILLVSSAALPLAGNLAYILNPHWTGGFDFAPFLFAASVMIIGCAILYVRWLDMMPLGPQSLLEHLREGICLFDQKERLVECNPSASTLLGISESMIGKPAVEVLGELLHVLSFPLDKKTHICDVMPSGSERVLEVLRVGVQVSRGRSFWKLITVRDVTDRRQAEEERMLLQEELLQSRKLDLVGRIAGGVAHEFNNRLMSMMGYAQLSYDEALPEQENIRKYQTEILEVGEKTAVIVGQLLAYASQHPSRPQKVDVNAFIADQFSLLEQVAGADISLQWRPCQETYFVMIDPAQLNQIIMQLVLNAREAIGECAGEILLQTSNEPSGLANIASLPPDLAASRCICLDIVDTGGGIDPTIAEQLFEPFVSTKGVGRGMGLATVFGIARQHGGYVCADRLPEGKTRFRVIFPIAD